MILIGKLFNWFNQIPNQFIEFYAYNQETAVIWCQKMVLKVKFLIFQIVLILTVIYYIKKRSFTIWFLKPSLFLFWRFLIPSSTVPEKFVSVDIYTLLKKTNFKNTYHVQSLLLLEQRFVVTFEWCFFGHWNTHWK